jgi:1-deoxy-D-xylulose-5-phosphate reductoisomerase
MKNVTILGSTGSIGTSTLEVIKRFPERFKVTGLAARSNIRLLENQVRAFRPEVVAVFDESAGNELRKKNLPVEILTGDKGVIELSSLGQAEIVVSAIVGSAGLMPTLAAIRAGKDIALASKESLVMAGSIIMTEASNRGVMILPVDSEHSAIFQCLNGKKDHEVHKIILTASGGPFYNKDLSELRDITPEVAVRHPNWLMGRKISVDSATLMNKGLEVIEAHWLFDVPADKIEVLVHPQSIIHSMVEFIDGSVIAQLSVPDMKGPIGYALSYPQRSENIMESLDLASIGKLTFEKPDKDRHRCLALTYDAMRTGGTMPSVLNSANEVAVEAFLDGEILFTDIPAVVADTMARHSVSEGRNIEDIIGASEWARETSRQVIRSLSR